MEELEGTNVMHYMKKKKKKSINLLDPNSNEKKSSKQK